MFLCEGVTCRLRGEEASRSANQISPASGISSPAIRRSAVVLPQPRSHHPGRDAGPRWIRNSDDASKSWITSTDSGTDGTRRRAGPRCWARWRCRRLPRQTVCISRAARAYSCPVAPRPAGCASTPIRRPRTGCGIDVAAHAIPTKAPRYTDQ